MGDFFVQRPALALAITACLLGFGLAFVRGGLEHRSASASAGPGGLLCTQEHWDPAIRSWTCLTWTFVHRPAQFPTRPDPAGCPIIALDRQAWKWRCATPA